MIFNLITNAKDLFYSNKTSHLTATNTQDAIDELNTNLVNQKGDGWTYVVGSFNSANHLRYKVLNSRCYVEMRLENLSMVKTETQFINDGTFPKPYGDIYRLGIDGMNKTQNILVHINTSGGLTMASGVSGSYYPISAFDYELTP